MTDENTTPDPTTGPTPAPTPATPPTEEPAPSPTATPVWTPSSEPAATPPAGTTPAASHGGRNAAIAVLVVGAILAVGAISFAAGRATDDDDVPGSGIHRMDGDQNRGQFPNGGQMPYGGQMPNRGMFPGQGDGDGFRQGDRSGGRQGRGGQMPGDGQFPGWQMPGDGWQQPDATTAPEATQAPSATEVPEREPFDDPLDPRASVGRVEDRLGLHLDLPARVEQPRHDDHRARRPDGAEDPAVGLRNGYLVGSVDEVASRPDDVLRTGARLGQGAQDDLEAARRLDAGIGVAGAVRPDRRGARDEHAIADADGSAEADRRLVWRPGRDPLTLHGDRVRKWQRPGSEFAAGVRRLGGDWTCPPAQIPPLRRRASLPLEPDEANPCAGRSSRPSRCWSSPSWPSPWPSPRPWPARPPRGPTT